MQPVGLVAADQAVVIHQAQARMAETGLQAQAELEVDQQAEIGGHLQCVP